MVFTEGCIQLETSPIMPKYFSTTITNEFGTFTHLHCLITYECITPEIIQSSKDRSESLSSLSFLKEEMNLDESSSCLSYIPVAVCLVTSSSYIDLFREILESLYSYLLDIRNSQISKKSLIASVEFIRLASLLLNDVVIPPYNIQVSLRIGGNDIEIPVEANTGLPHVEKCIAILVDLIDIRNIIEFWECLVLNKHAFLMSCNEYLLYLILEAFKELLFPLKWSLYIVPVLSPNLLEVTASPVPILIGLNNTKVKVQQVLRENPTACILDIDSNILYNSNPQMLCNCQKSIISKKLQLVKAYYYVSKERLGSYRMHSLEINIDDNEFVNTAKLLIEGNQKEKEKEREREKIFISLIKHIFLDFFIKGLGKINTYCTYESFEEKFEFNKNKFLQFVKECEICKMKEFWTDFLQSSTFSQFIEFEGKFDDSYYKRYLEILNCVSKGQYKIYNSGFTYKCNILSSVTPRNLLELIKADVFSKPKSFLTDSIKILRKEVREQLLEHKVYYRHGERDIHYKARPPSSLFIYEHNSKSDRTNQYVYYGDLGIIRLSTLLISHLSIENFEKLSLLNDTIIPQFDLHYTETNSQEPLNLKLFYLIKDDITKWNTEKIAEVLYRLSLYKDVTCSVQLIASIMNEIFNKYPEKIKLFYNLTGEIGSFAKRLSKQVNSPIKVSPYNYLDSGKEDSFTERSKLYKFNTIRDTGQRRPRDHTRTKTFAH